jgi:ribosome-associated protein
LTSEKLAHTIAGKALEKKAGNVVILDLRHISDVADYFVICSGDSDTHVKAVADHIDDEMRREGSAPWKKEGTQKLLWVLLDFVDVVVHVFQPKIREFYDLERLWGDAKREVITDPQA